VQAIERVGKNPIFHRSLDPHPPALKNLPVVLPVAGKITTVTTLDKEIVPPRTKVPGLAKS